MIFQSDVKILSQKKQLKIEKPRSQTFYGFIDQNCKKKTILSKSYIPIFLSNYQESPLKSKLCFSNHTKLSHFCQSIHFQQKKERITLNSLLFPKLKYVKKLSLNKKQEKEIENSKKYKNYFQMIEKNVSQSIFINRKNIKSKSQGNFVKNTKVFPIRMKINSKKRLFLENKQLIYQLLNKQNTHKTKVKKDELKLFIQGKQASISDFPIKISLSSNNNKQKYKNHLKINLQRQNVTNMLKL